MNKIKWICTIEIVVTKINVIKTIVINYRAAGSLLFIRSIQ